MRCQFQVKKTGRRNQRSGSTSQWQIQFAARPGPGAVLRSLAIDVRDDAGNVVFQAADQIGRAKYVHTNACGFVTPRITQAFAKKSCGPMRIYHIEHLSAAGWTPEGEKARTARLEAKGLSEMQYPNSAKRRSSRCRYQARSSTSSRLAKVPKLNSVATRCCR